MTRGQAAARIRADLARRKRKARKEKVTCEVCRPKKWWEDVIDGMLFRDLKSCNCDIINEMRDKK